MIHQILISDENEMRRCQMACAKRVATLVSGVDAKDSSFRVYRGIVKNVEDYHAGSEKPVLRWRVTIQS